MHPVITVAYGIKGRKINYEPNLRPGFENGDCVVV